jgi:hypothetical protein
MKINWDNIFKLYIAVMLVLTSLSLLIIFWVVIIQMILHP